MPLPLQPTDYELNAAVLQRSEFVTANCFYARAGPGCRGRLRRALHARPGGKTAICSSRCSSTMGPPQRRPALGIGSDERASLMTGAIRCASCSHADGDRVSSRPARPAGVSVSQQQQETSSTRCCTRSIPALPATARTGPPWHYYGILRRCRRLRSSPAVGSTRLGWRCGGCVWLLLTGRFCSARLAEHRARSRTMRGNGHHIADDPAAGHLLAAGRGIQAPRVFL